MGMGVFLVSLGILFGATLVGFLVMRVELARRGMWPQDLPTLPRGLWISTLILLVSSGTMQWATFALQRNDQLQLSAGMILTFALGIGFLIMQTICWLGWLTPVVERWSASGEYRFALTSFYLLTGLHALHVIGGLIPMAVVTRRAIAGKYSPQEDAGVRHTAMYWHFLDAVWVVLFICIMAGQ